MKTECLWKSIGCFNFSHTKLRYQLLSIQILGCKKYTTAVLDTDIEPCIICLKNASQLESYTCLDLFLRLGGKYMYLNHHSWLEKCRVHRLRTKNIRRTQGQKQELKKDVTGLSNSNFSLSYFEIYSKLTFTDHRLWNIHPSHCWYSAKYPLWTFTLNGGNLLGHYKQTNEWTYSEPCI